RPAGTSLPLHRARRGHVGQYERAFSGGGGGTVLRFRLSFLRPLLPCHPFALPPCHPFALSPCHPERSEGSALICSSGTSLLRAGSERSDSPSEASAKEEGSAPLMDGWGRFFGASSFA